MWTPDYFVRYLDFPLTVDGVTVPNSDGTFDIYISSHLSEARRRQCLEHELRHLSLDHFYSPRTVENMEREADGQSPVNVCPTVFNLPTSTHIPLFPSLSALQAYLTHLSNAL